MDRKLVVLYSILILPCLFLILIFPELFGNTFMFVKQDEVDINTMLNQSERNSYATVPDKYKGNIVFVLDDGFSTQYTQAFGLFKKYGMRSGISVVPNCVGTSGYMSLGQLSELYLNGWDMTDQTYSHKDLTTLDYHDQEQEINSCRDWLLAHHFNAGSDIVVFPEGIFNNDTFEVLKNNNYTAAKGLESVWLINPQARLDDVALYNLNNKNTIEAIEAMIDKVSAQTTSAIFLLHKIEDADDPDGMNFSSANLEQVLKYINANKNNLEVLTMTELFKKLKLSS